MTERRVIRKRVYRFRGISERWRKRLEHERKHELEHGRYDTAFCDMEQGGCSECPATRLTGHERPARTGARQDCAALFLADQRHKPGFTDACVEDYIDAMCARVRERGL